MQGNSQPVRSPQARAHPGLARRLRRAKAGYARPVRPQAEALFRRLQVLREAFPALVLDHGCGTGESTRRLAERHPDALVAGIDRAAARLARAGLGASGWLQEGNRVLLHADCLDILALARAAGWRAAAQYFLYPSPWPKPRHLRRRWHAHPAFPDVLALGGRLELRTNWAPYAEEFAAAITLLAPERRVALACLEPDEPTTAFERKYHASGHTLYRVTAA